HRVESERRRIEENAFALDLLDDGAPGEHVLERLAAGQATMVEVEVAQLGQRVILVANRSAYAVLGAEVAHEERDDQRVGLVTGRLEEAGGAECFAVVVLEVAEKLHLEEAAGVRAGDPWAA